ncbi:coiled-coil domain-containing protein 150-like isoform X2 [Dreissena polymorpha]|uniref:coiled-coil domain-containing protein 150-like isoform X2 n=1 Tax=Dreissena polymorpha TaxID=45954 RepID=UPI0022640FF6|nr:coiled-coil domain-containing protein 150-like isoform X2 [Dreissena polymorpha]
MSLRAVIPPLSVNNGPSKQSYEVLESRLRAAEDDTKQLIDQLGGMGFDNPGPGSGENGRNSPYHQNGRDSPYQPVSPFRGQTRNVNYNQENFEKFKSSYESLVTRVCKNESALQSLKLTLVNLQGDQKLNTKQDVREMKEKFQYAREAYEQEIGKLTRQVEYLKEELGSEVTAKEKCRDEIRELQRALEQSTETRMEAAMTAEGLNMSQAKLQKRITELKEEVAREQSLRASLEESHNTLLTRVREMESLVETERTGVQSLSSDYAHIRNDNETLRELLKEETKRKQIAESSYKMLCDDKDSLVEKYRSCEGDRDMLITEVSKLREQYEDLIKQLEQTQAIIDKQQEIFLSDKLKTADQLEAFMTKNKELVEENERLTQTFRTTAEEHDKINAQLKRELEAERRLTRDKAVVEDKASRLKDSVAEITQENLDLRKKIKRSEEEVSKLKTRISSKDEEFTRTAESLSKELSSLQDQLQQQQADRDRILKDKESLLEEVNQTVDSMVEERSKLQKQVQQQQLELDGHSRARRKLEHENAHLLERISGFEQQQHGINIYMYQQAQKHVESTLKEMMDQKNKLAYDNGRLQTTLEQANLELESLRKADLETNKYRTLAEALANKYSQCESDISELKVTIERLESQLKQAHIQLDSRHGDYSSITVVKDELLKENQRLLTKLQSVEDRERRKIKSLQKNNEDAKAVNKEIASTLESVMASHSQLQSVVESLQVELGKKDSVISRLKTDKNREQQEWKVEMRKFEERMDSLREELRRERDVSNKKNSKDIGEIKKQNDSLSARNMELMKGNTELRQKTRDQETEIGELREKLGEQKRKIEYLRRGKNDVEENVKKMKEMKADIEELESLRDTYISKNQEQAEMISTFMGQINSLQTELRQLAHAQSQTADLVTQKERSLEKERKLKEDIRKRYKINTPLLQATKRREDELDHMKSAAEKRLSEVREESLEISNHLKSAHEWFKDKFDNLQSELVASRRLQEKLEVENTEQQKKLNGERNKAQAAAQKAREMIRASRQTISRLSDYADLADSETKQQLHDLYSQLTSERDHAKYVEMKHDRYKDASARQFEHLLNDTEDSCS